MITRCNNNNEFQNNVHATFSERSLLTELIITSLYDLQDPEFEKETRSWFLGITDDPHFSFRQVCDYINVDYLKVKNFAIEVMNGREFKRFRFKRIGDGSIERRAKVRRDKTFSRIAPNSGNRGTGESNGVRLEEVRTQQLEEGAELSQANICNS